jgi:hypothetical protein
VFVALLVLPFIVTSPLRSSSLTNYHKSTAAAVHQAPLPSAALDAKKGEVQMQLEQVVALLVSWRSCGWLHRDRAAVPGDNVKFGVLPLCLQLGCIKLHHATSQISLGGLILVNKLPNRYSLETLRFACGLHGK